MGLLRMGGSRVVEQQWGNKAPPSDSEEGRVRMRPSTSNIFHTSLAFLPISLPARRTSMRGAIGVQEASGAVPLAPAMEQEEWKPPRGSWFLLSCGGSLREGMHESQGEHSIS
jgi:hypothetical protein